MVSVRTTLIASFLAVSVAHASDELLIIEKLAEKQRKTPGLRMTFSEVRQTRALKQPVRTNGLLEIKPPDKFRKEAKTLTLSDGRTLWLVEADRTSVFPFAGNLSIREKLAPFLNAFDLTSLAQNFKIRASREGKGWLLELVPRRPAIRKGVESLEVHLNATLEVTRTRVVSANDEVITTDYGPPKEIALPDSRFVYTPLEGREVVYPLGK